MITINFDKTLRILWYTCLITTITQITKVIEKTSSRDTTKSFTVISFSVTAIDFSNEENNEEPETDYDTYVSHLPPLVFDTEKREIVDYQPSSGLYGFGSLR